MPAAYGHTVSGSNQAIIGQLRKDAIDLLHKLCDRAGIAHSNRHEALQNYIHEALTNCREGDPLFADRDKPRPSSEALKRDLQRGPPARPIGSTERRVRIVDGVLNATGSYAAVCDRYWKALHLPQPDDSEVWFQVTFPEMDPLRGPVGRQYTAIDIVGLESHGEEIQASYQRVSPEDESSLGLRWRAVGYQREGYRFLAFASLDSVRNRSAGAVTLRLVGDAREEHYEGFYVRPGDPAAAHHLQLERRRVAWFRSAPLAALPRIALLDWDNSLHDGWTLVRWTEFLNREKILGDGGALARKLAELLRAYPAKASHDELAVQTSEVYAQALEGIATSTIADAAQRFVSDPRCFRPYRWADTFLHGLCDLGVAPIIISGAPAEVLAAWATPREEFVAACFGLDAPHAASAALSSQYLAVLPGTVNPATTEGKRQLVDQLKRLKRRVVLAVGDSESDLALWEAAENHIYVGTIVRQHVDDSSDYILSEAVDADASVLLEWVEERVGSWDAADVLWD